MATARLHLAALAAATAVVGVLAVAPVHAAAPTLAKGAYAGTIADPDGDVAPYTVRIRIKTTKLRARRSAGSISYSAPSDPAAELPAAACRGTLSYRSRKGRRFTFRETMPTGSSCVIGATVTLTRVTARRLTYTWTTATETATPSGTLVR